MTDTLTKLAGVLAVVGIYALVANVGTARLKNLAAAGPSQRIEAPSRFEPDPAMNFDLPRR